MTDLKQQLKGILERHEGRARAITSRELSQLTGEPDRKVRLVIRELISEGSRGICSVNPGPFNRRCPPQAGFQESCRYALNSSITGEAGLVEQQKLLDQLR